MNTALAEQQGYFVVTEALEYEAVLLISKSLSSCFQSDSLVLQGLNMNLGSKIGVRLNYRPSVRILLF